MRSALSFVTFSAAGLVAGELDHLRLLPELIRKAGGTHVSDRPLFDGESGDTCDARALGCSEGPESTRDKGARPGRTWPKSELRSNARVDQGAGEQTRSQSSHAHAHTTGVVGLLRRTA